VPAVTRAVPLSIGLVAAHTLAHLVLPTRWWQGPHVAANLAVAAAAARSDRVALRGDGDWPRQLSVTAAAVVGTAALTYLAMQRRGLHRSYAEERVASLPPGRRWVHLAVMIPLATVLPEEVLFRGLLQQRWEEATGRWWGGVLGSAVVFGLWHSGPSLAALRRLNPSLSPPEVATAVVRTVAATAVAGVGFSALRVLSGGLAAPIGAHLAVNLVGSAEGRRRLTTQPG
jgi:uncharacterized protein